MHGEGHPIGVLCGTHVIRILMFLDGNGPSCKTEIYSAVGRSATMPQKIASLADAGLVVLRRKGISEEVWALPCLVSFARLTASWPERDWSKQLSPGSPGRSFHVPGVLMW